MAGKFLTNGSWSDEPLGYIYQADIYCPACTVEILISQRKASPAARDMISVEVMEQISQGEGVDFDDEYSYDSDEFPKLVTTSEGSGTYCGRCGTELEEN